MVSDDKAALQLWIAVTAGRREKMEHKYIISRQTANRIIGGEEYIKMSKRFGMENFHEGDTIYLKASQENGDYHPVREKRFKITMPRSIDAYSFELYFEHDGGKEEEC